MNEDIFRYKTRFISLVLLLAYAYMHVKLAGVYIDTRLDDMINFSVRLPFGQRMLVPTLAHLLRKCLPFLNVEELFFIFEWLFISLFFMILKILLSRNFPQRQAQLLSWLYILLLPLMSIINYRFTAGGEATFFYPCDSASLFFMASGILLCLEKRWAAFVAVVFIATFNRESSILLVLLIPTLHWQTKTTLIKPLLASTLAYILARLIILYLVQDLSGSVMEWYYRASTHTLFEINLLWLLDEQNLLMFMFCFAGLPLFWYAFFDYIPEQFRPLRYLTLFYFLALLLIGNFNEIRIFNEILILLYLPVCLAVNRWQTGQPPYPIGNKNLVFYLDRGAILMTLTVVVIFRQPLNTAVIALSHFF